MSRFNLVLSNVFAAALSLLIAMPALWMLLLDREPPYERLEGFMEPPEPKPGQEVTIRWHIRVNRSCQSLGLTNSQRKVIDSYGVVWPLMNMTTEDPVQVAPDQLIRVLRLPIAVAPGPASYYSEICFACNPLQRVLMPVCIDHPTLKFEVGPLPGDVTFFPPQRGTSPLIDVTTKTAPQ